MKTSKGHKPSREYTCPTCKAVFLGVLNRPHSFCTDCQNKRSYENASKILQDERAASLRAAMLDDIIADETRMPWERKHSK